MKKFLSAILSIIMMSGLILPVSAIEDTFNISVTDASNGILTVSGTLENKNDLNNSAMVFMLEKNCTLSDYDGNTIAMSWAETDFDTGTYTCSFSVDVSSDTYEFYVVSKNKTYHQSYNYVALSDVIQLIKNIRDGIILPDNALTEIKKLNNGIGADLSMLNDEAAETLFSYRIKDKRTKIDGVTNSEILLDFLEIIKEISDEKVFLNSLKNANQWSEVKVILKNNKFITIDFSDFNLISSSNQTKVLTAFIDKEIYNADEVKTFFDTEVRKYPKASSPAGGGGGGGGGAGGGGIVSKEPQRFYEIDKVTPSKTETKVKFNDLISVPWAAEAIVMLSENGIISGVSENEYAPNDTVTREQFAKLLAGAIGIFDPDATCEFSDAQGDWYTPYIASVKNAGLINGTGNNEFGVGLNITRQDMAVMIYNALKYKNSVLTDEKDGFSDSEKIADYAKTAVRYLAGAGIINGMGDGSFAPDNNATRAEAAVLIYKMMGRL